MAVADYDPIIEEAAANWNVDPNWGRAILQQESGGNPTRNGQPIRSSAGAGGLAQFMPGTAAAVGVEDVDNPKQAIWGMFKHLSQLYDQFDGNVMAATAAYNANPDVVKAWVNGKGQLPSETQKYVPAVAAHYAMFSKANAGQQPQAANDVPSDDDFLKSINPQQSAAPAVPPGIPVMRITPGDSVPSDEEFLQQIRPNNPAPKAQTGPQNQSQDDIVRGDVADLMMPAIPQASVATSGNALGGDQWVPQVATTPNALSTSYQTVTNALAPAPGTTYGNILPFARDNQTGAIRMALPSSLRSLAQGGADLAFGPGLGTVTPQASMALANVVPGLMQSPAAMPGRFSVLPRGAAQPQNALTSTVPPPPQRPLMFPGTAAESSAPAFVPPSAAGPANDLARIQQLIRADEQVAANRPQFVPPTTAVDPLTGQATAIRQPPNPLAPAEAPSSPATTVNPLSVAPAPKASPPQAAPIPNVAAQEAAETAAIPEQLPPAPLVPPLTKEMAETRADQLLRHFSAGKPVEQNPDIVPGYMPKLAGLTNDPGIATLERGVQAVNPGPIGLRDQANAEAISSFLNKLQGTHEDVLAAQAARDVTTAPLRDEAFANEQPVNAAPIVTQIDKILASPEGKRAAVQRTLENVRGSLFDSGGTLETDPSMLYGVRKNLNDLLDPVAQKDNPQLQQAARQLLDIKSHLDDVIEEGAPGFKNYVAQYADISKPIDAQRYLQSLNLTNAADNVRLQSVDSAIKSIERQQNMPGVQKATAVSPEQLNALRTLRNTLRMNQFSASAGKHLGSNTFQNLATNSIAGQVTGNPLVTAGLGVLGTIGGGVPGAIIAPLANMGTHHMLGRAEMMVREAIVKRLLNHEGTGAAALTPTP